MTSIYGNLCLMFDRFGAEPETNDDAIQSIEGRVELTDQGLGKHLAFLNLMLV